MNCLDILLSEAASRVGTGSPLLHEPSLISSKSGLGLELGLGLGLTLASHSSEVL